jgi:hypothetical protein
MCVADEDLWNRAPSGDSHHVFHGLRVLVDTNFFDGFNAFGLEDAFRPNAVGTNGGGVHFDGLHGYFSRLSASFQACSRGKLASFQLLRPPAKACTFVKPSFLATATARLERTPEVQTKISGNSLFLTCPANFSSS